MSLGFPAAAVSRLDGGTADGIHLLWSPPPVAGYSADGFDVQRRESQGRPEPACYELTPAELATLHDFLVVRTRAGRVELRQAPCPRLPDGLLDEPYGEPQEPTERCVRFDGEEPGSTGPNPRDDDGFVVTVHDPGGTPRATTEVREEQGVAGLDAGFETWIDLPAPATRVSVTLACFATEVYVDAVGADGSRVASATTATLGAPETVSLGGAGIVRVVVRAPKDETLLVEVCAGSGGSATPACTSFEKAEESEAEGSVRRQDGFAFEVHDDARQPVGYTRLVEWGGLRGLDCGFWLTIALPFAASEVSVRLAHFAYPADVVALAADGSELDRVTMTAQGVPEIVVVRGAAIHSVVVEAPKDETVLLEVCATPAGGGERTCASFTEEGAPGFPVEVFDHAGSQVQPPRVVEWGGVRGLDCGFRAVVALPFAAREVSVRLAQFSSPADVVAVAADGSELDRLTTAAQGVPETVVVRGAAIHTVAIEAPGDETVLVEVCATPAGDEAPDAIRQQAPEPVAKASVARAADRTCLAYEVTLAAPSAWTRVGGGASGWLAIAFRHGKAVASEAAGDDGTGFCESTFANVPADRVVVYVTSALTRLVVCTEPAPDPEEEAREWAEVPYLARGIQVPARRVDPGLTDGADELALARSRLLPGETFDPAHFAEVADVLNDAVGAARDAAPTWATRLTREKAEDPFLDVRPWGLALSLLVDPAWRRVLGFGFFDDGRRLAAGTGYDYRVSGRFRLRDVAEELLGFATVPAGTTLPASFHLGPVEVVTSAPAQVALDNPPAGGGLLALGRKGITVRHAEIRLPVPARSLALDLAPGSALTFEATTTGWLPGLSGNRFVGPVPNGSRAVLTFPEEVDTVLLHGNGFLYGIRLAPVAGPGDLVEWSAIVRDVRYEATDPPSPPAFVGTTNLQQPPAATPPGSPPVAAPAPGFRVRWLPPPPSPSATPPLWPPDVASAPPFAALGFRVERRGVDPPSAFAPLEDGLLHYGSRGSRRDVPQLRDGIDLLATFPAAPRPQPPVSPLMDCEDVLVSMDTGGPPPGSLHQYRVWSVDVLGRVSTTPATGSVVRLEKRAVPPAPVAPPAAPPAGVRQPSGVRARVLLRGQVLTAEDTARLGSGASAVVLEWGWTAAERRRDPYVTEFRVYTQPLPPDAVPGRITAAATTASGGYDVPVSFDRHVAADAMAGRFLDAGNGAFKVVSHPAGQHVTVRVEPSPTDAGLVPAPGTFVFNPPLTGAELHPPAWERRALVVPLTAAESYEAVLRDLVVPSVATPRVRAWVGVSAADGQAYVPDALPGTAPNGGRPGNESSVAVVPVLARYAGQPVFTVPPPLVDVPEQASREPAGDTVAVPLDLAALLPAGAVPAGHRLRLERLGLDALVAMLSARDDDSVQARLPDGSTVSWTLGNPADRAAFAAQLRGGDAARVENRFLMDALLDRVRVPLEPLWAEALPEPVALGPVTDRLPAKPQRWVHRVRLVDAAGHLSSGSRVLGQVVRVRSLRVPGAPEVTLVPNGDGVDVSARAVEAYDLRWVLLFAVPLAAGGRDDRLDRKPHLLRLPDRHDLYPGDGVRLRLRDGTLVAPTVVAASTGTVALPHRTVAGRAVAGFDTDVAVWAATMTRDGITSPVAGPRVARTEPAPLTLPALAVAATGAEDTATVTGTTNARAWALERSTDGGATWARVSPWLDVTVTSRHADRPPGARQYRLAVRGSRDRTATGPPVAVT